MQCPQVPAASILVLRKGPLGQLLLQDSEPHQMR